MRSGKTSAAIVGVHMKDPIQAFDPKAVYVLHASAPSDPILCFELISRDGRYTARVKYALIGTHDTLSRLDFQTQYGDTLSGYTTEDVATLAYTSPGCDPAHSTSLLVVGGIAQSAGFISIQVRAAEKCCGAILDGNQHKVSFQLRMGGSAPNVCRVGLGVSLSKSRCQGRFGRDMRFFR